VRIFRVKSTSASAAANISAPHELDEARGFAALNATALKPFFRKLLALRVEEIGRDGYPHSPQVLLGHSSYSSFLDSKLSSNPSPTSL